MTRSQALCWLETEATVFLLVNGSSDSAWPQRILSCWSPEGSPFTEDCLEDCWLKSLTRKPPCHYSGGSLSAPRTVYSERNILEWIAKKVLWLKNNSTLSITLFSSFIFLKTFCGIKHASTYRISFCKWTIKGVIHEISDKVLINASPPAIHLLKLFQLFIYFLYSKTIFDSGADKSCGSLLHGVTVQYHQTVRSWPAGPQSIAVDSRRLKTNDGLLETLSLRWPVLWRGIHAPVEFLVVKAERFITKADSLSMASSLAKGTQLLPHFRLRLS